MTPFKLRYILKIKINKVREYPSKYAFVLDNLSASQNIN